MYLFLGTKSIPWAKVAEADHRVSKSCLLKSPNKELYLGSAERSEPSLSEGLSHVSGCLLPISTPWELVVPSSGPSVPPIPATAAGPNTPLTTLITQSGFSVCLLPHLCQHESSWREETGSCSFFEPRAYLGPAGQEQGFCVCLMNTWMDKCVD